MGIRIDPSFPDRDWSGVVKPTLEAIVKLITKDYFDAAFKAHEASKEFRRREETLEQRVWTLWRESLAIALPEFFVTAALTRRPDDEELGRLLQDILKDSEAVAKTGRVQFEDVHLRTPTDFPLYKLLREKLPEWARQVAPDHLRDDERLRERLDQAFERGFRRALADRSGHFSELRNHFVGNEAETENRRDAWERYYDGLSREIEEIPLFNQPDDGSGATLGAIFQPLRCHWREQVNRDRREFAKIGRRLEKVHIAWLQETLNEWLEIRNSRDALRVVTGGPGSGKSSSALWFARDIALHGSVNVFVIRLQGLDVDQPLDAIVEEFIDLAGTDHGMLEDSPLKWLREDPKTLLLIFDGLDEVARTEDVGLEITKTFLRTLHTHLGQANRDVRARLMALVLGRPQAAEEAVRAMGGLPKHALLHVASLGPIDPQRLSSFGGTVSSDIVAPEGLADEDFRIIFYERYRPFDRFSSGNRTSDALSDYDLAEMTVEPLLLYLLIISGYAGGNWHLAKDNRNHVYEQIFQDIHERDLQKPGGHPSKMGIEKKEDFFALMECLGLAAWPEGGRSGANDFYELIRDSIYITKRGGRFRERKSAKLGNVAVQTFTQRRNEDDDGYAFVHKSFGEYLVARALVEAGERWLERHNDDPNDFVLDWFQLTSFTRLTTDILRFMIDEARLRTTKSCEVHGRIRMLATIADHVLQHGIPAHTEQIAHSGTADWRRREILQRNAEEALYALINAWTTAGFPFAVNERGLIERDWEPGPFKVAWTTERSAKAMLARLNDQWSTSGFSYGLFQFWDLSGAYLREANLCNADLRGASLGEADLRGVDLSAADLRGADLGKADLSDADLTATKLCGANLAFTKLRAADLSMADMRSVDLRGADLTRADLVGANLSWANLQRANCNRMDLDSARVQFTDFSETISLHQEQINGAFGNSRTKLPIGLAFPEDRLKEY